MATMMMISGVTLGLTVGGGLETFSPEIHIMEQLGCNEECHEGVRVHQWGEKNMIDLDDDE